MEDANKVSIKLPEPGQLIVSSSPHVHDNSGTAKIMLQVILCLVPAILAAVWFFGLPALQVILLCTAFSILFEFGWNRLMRQHPTIGDFSAAVTGVILALNLPASAPWWMCAVGAFIAIVIAKQIYGGLGQNPFNPAAVARVALLVGFTAPMTTKWIAPQRGVFFYDACDAVTTATPLSQANQLAGNASALAALQTSENYWNWFVGNMGGSLGETSALAILIGLAGLLAFRLIRWQIPAAILATVVVFAWIVNSVAPGVTPGPLFHLLTGGVMLGAVFMATDTVTSPVTAKGCVLFGIGIGVIASIIRIWGAYPEGMSFAIIIMNALVPLIDKVCYTRPFGWVAFRGGAR